MAKHDSNRDFTESFTVGSPVRNNHGDNFQLERIIILVLGGHKSNRCWTFSIHLQSKIAKFSEFCWIIKRKTSEKDRVNYFEYFTKHILILFIIITWISNDKMCSLAFELIIKKLHKCVPLLLKFKKLNSFDLCALNLNN